ncbi:hypothetical protein Tco_0679882 [Tanacetum coccineum]|uniref:Uncharacterized protein n=1 Tax=Tanacetum coccineum TaxID=301880 RepID=A0ABQ4XK34_9ASTR
MSFGVATLKAVVHAGDKTSVDARCLTINICIVAQEWVNPETSPWKVKEGPLITTSSANRWSILESEVGSSQESGKLLASNVLFENEPSSSSTSSSNAAAALKQDDVLVEHVANYLIKITERVHQLPNMLDELSKHGLIHQVSHLIDLKSHTTLSQSVHIGLIGLLVKLASGSMIAIEAFFDLNISSILKYILSTYGLSHGISSPRAFDGQDNQLVPIVTRNHDVQLAEENAAFLTNNPRQLQTFGNDMLHVLIQVVDFGVDLSICYGCLSVIDKLLYYINFDKLLDLFKQTNISRISMRSFAVLPSGKN